MKNSHVKYEFAFWATAKQLVPVKVIVILNKTTIFNIHVQRVLKICNGCRMCARKSMNHK